LADQFERYHWFIVALLALPLLGGIFLLAKDRLSDPAELQITNTEAVPADIRVYISGAVQNPGVYPLKDGDRWIDALEVAGGPAANADLNAVNLSKRVQDEDQIFVPGQGGDSPAANGQKPLININTAGEAELQTLPGIGEVRARSIVQSRTTQGPFAFVEELLTRKVVPQSVFADIEPLVTIQ
jgi:competence protein ComEA